MRWARILLSTAKRCGAAVDVLVERVGGTNGADCADCRVEPPTLRKQIHHPA
jgi:hypothetical protein